MGESKVLSELVRTESEKERSDFFRKKVIVKSKSLSIYSLFKTLCKESNDD